MGKFDDEGPEHPFPADALPKKPNGDGAHIQGPPPPLSWPDLATREPPARRWALKGWLGYGHATLLVGSGGIGKTLIAQQIGSALALGVPHFIDEIPAPLKVLMWACEDDHDELWRRQVAIARHFDSTLDAYAENFVLVPRHGQDNAIAVSEYGKLQFTGLEQHLSEQVNDHHADVVILDNAAQLYGAGENDRHAVTAFLNRLTGILGDNRALLLLAHPSRAQGSEFSGSGAWENVARTRLYLGSKLPDEKDAAAQGDEADDHRYLARRKANYSHRDWRRFTYTDGVLVPDAVEAGGGLIAVLREERAESIVLDGLRKLQAMHLDAAEGSKSGQYLPKLLLEYNLSDGRTRQELASAMRRLMSDNRLVKTVIGKSANRSPKYGLTIPDTPIP